MSERTIRTQLAAAFRWAARLNFHEATANHFSAVVDDDRFLMNRRGAHFSRVKASELLLLDSATEGAPAEADSTAWYLHGQIHRLVPAAKVILHTHMPYATTLACLADYEFLMLDQNACRFYRRIGYDRAYAGMALDDAEGERIAKLLVEHPILLLGNHGVIVTAATIAQAFDELYYFEKACQLQVLALSTGRELSLVPDQIAAVAEEQWRTYPQAAELHFTALMEILDVYEPDYRD